MYQKVLSLLKSKYDAVSKTIEAEGSDQIKRDWMPFVVTLETFIECLDQTGPAVVPVAPVIPAVAPVAPAAVVPPVSKVTAKPRASISKPVVNTMYGDKFRRLKDNGVRKPSYKQRDLLPQEHDALNSYWNDTQKLIDRKDPVCGGLVQTCAVAGEKPIFAYQVGGWFSFLARLARLPQADRDNWINVQMTKYKKYTIRPIFSQALIDECIKHYQKEQEELRIRAQAHANIRAQRKLIMKTDSAAAPVVAPEETA
jgi:hypothetical protein